MRNALASRADIRRDRRGHRVYPIPMLIWINGPMGVGKTQVAHELKYRIPESFICDPELLGLAIQKMMPKEMRTEFQSFALWRHGTMKIAADIATHFDGVVLIPMTLLDGEHHEEVVGSLKANGHDVYHFSLMASPESLLRRLRSRGDGKDSYGATRIDACLKALGRPRFATHIQTDGRTIESIADEIAESVGVELAPSGSRLNKRARRLMVTMRHIRR